MYSHWQVVEHTLQVLCSGRNGKVNQTWLNPKTLLLVVLHVNWHVGLVDVVIMGWYICDKSRVICKQVCALKEKESKEKEERNGWDGMECFVTKINKQPMMMLLTLSVIYYLCYWLVQRQHDTRWCIIRDPEYLIRYVVQSMIGCVHSCHHALFSLPDKRVYTCIMYSIKWCVIL